VRLLQVLWKDDNSASSRENRTASPYRVLLVDNHAVVLHGLKASIGSLPGVEICGEATSGREALKLAKIAMPDLVILDLSLPAMNGLEAARAIRKALPRTAVLVVTMHASEDIARLALRSGARGLVAKSDSIAELIAAVQNVREHKPYVTSQLAAKLQDELERIKAQRSVEDFPLPDPRLTREQIAAVLARAEEKIRQQAAEMLSKNHHYYGQAPHEECHGKSDSIQQAKSTKTERMTHTKAAYSGASIKDGEEAAGTGTPLP
jgi:two-component system response regulator NreC